MNPEQVGAGSEGAKHGWRWKQMGNEAKAAAIDEEMKRIRLLPPTSSYVSHRLRVLRKIQHLLALQRTRTQDEELELLFSGLRL